MQKLVDTYLDQQPRGVLYAADELAGWVTAMGQYKSGRGADRQFWLSLWTNSSIKVDRRGSPPLFVERPFVNVVGGLPPDVLPKLQNEAGIEDGFIHRILFCYPESLHIDWSGMAFDPLAAHEFSTTIEHLWNLQPVEGRPKPVRFSDEAKEALIALFLRIYADLNHPDFPNQLRGPWAKLEAYTARLCLVLHLVSSWSTDVISVSTVEQVSPLLPYFQSHLRHVYAALHNTAEDKQVLRGHPMAETASASRYGARAGAI